MSIFVPNQENCDQLSLLLGNCEPAKPWQMTYLYTVLYITAFGAAGTDRLDEVLFIVLTCRCRVLYLYGIETFD